VIAADMARQGRELSAQLLAAHDTYDTTVEKAAATERDYRKARALAYLTCPAGTVDEKKAYIDGETSDLRYLRDLAVAKLKGDLELIRSQRQRLSYLQTWANQSKEEAAFSRTGPECTP
jgi:hypothetical protein